jgi:hypothetical protein
VNYFRKHKEYLKANIEKILPLMEELPEINEYHIAASSTSVADILTKMESKNFDISVIEIMRKWKNKTEDLTAARQKQGK